MKNKEVDLGKLPVGLVMIKYVYALIALISAFTAVFVSPYTNVIAYGKELGNLPAILVNSTLVIFSLLLYLGFSRPTITVWYLAFLYHIFFIGNNFLGLLSTLLPNSAITPVIQITGKTIYASTSSSEPVLPQAMKLFSLFNITMLLGIFILWYLWQKKEHFMPKSLLKKI